MKRVIPVILLVVLAVYLVVYGHGVPPTPHNAVRIKGKPVQDTTGNLTDNEILKYDAAKDSLIWEADGGGAGGSDSALFLTEAVGSGTRTVFWSNDTLYFKIGTDTVMTIVDLGTITQLTSYDNTSGFRFINTLNMLNNRLADVSSIFADTLLRLSPSTDLFIIGGTSGDIKIEESIGNLRWTFSDNRLTGTANATIVLDTITVASGTGIVAKNLIRLFVDDADSNLITSLDINTRIDDSLANYLPLVGGTLTGQLFIDGAANEVQLRIQAHSTQDSDIVRIENSAGTTLMLMDADGELEILHVASHIGSRAFKIEMDGAGIGTSAGMSINLETGNISAGEENQGVLINVDQSASTGGDVHGFEMLSTSTGSATAVALVIGTGVNVITHHSGVFGNLTFAEKRGSGAYIDWVTEGNSSASDITLWDAVNDTVFLGFATKFEELSWNWEIVATKDMQFTFAFSIAGPSFTVFSPTDGTNGARNGGNMAWDADDLASWASISVDGDAAFWIAIIRTRTSGTNPTEDLVKIAAPTDFTWDNLANISAHSIMIDSLGSATGSRILLTDPIFLGDSAIADSAYATRQQVEVLIEDSLNTYSATTLIVLRDGTNALTADWTVGDFNILDVQALDTDTLKNSADTIVVLDPLKIKDFAWYTGGNLYAQYDSADVPTNNQQLTWITGNILRWEDQGAGGAGNTYKLGVDSGIGDQAAFILGNDTTILQGTSTVRIGFDDQTVDTLDFSVVDASLLDVKMANDALSADKVINDATDDTFLDVAAGGTGAGTFVLGELLLGNTTGDLTGTGVLGTSVLMIGDNAGAPNFAAMSGDGLLVSGGTFTIQDNAVQESDVDITNAGSTADVLTKAAGDQMTWVTELVDANIPDHTGDVTGGTALTIAANAVDDTHIDFGTGANQVSIIDVPGTNWNVLHTNGSGVIIELSIGATGLVLKSNGTASAPTWQADNTGGASDSSLALVDVTGGFDVVRWNSDTLLFYEGASAAAGDTALKLYLSPTNDTTFFSAEGTVNFFNFTPAVNFEGNVIMESDFTVFNTIRMEGATVDAFQQIITTADPTVSDKIFNLPNDEIAAGDVMVGSGAQNVTYLGLATTEIVVGDGAGAPAAVSLSADVTMSNTGVVTIQDNAVQESDLEITNAGAAGEILTQGAGADDFTWVTILPVANGGSGAATFTDGGILLGSGTGAFTALGVATNGQIPIGDGATDPVLATLTAGKDITITNAAGSITIATETDTGTFALTISAPNGFVQDTLVIMKVDASKYSDSLIITELALETRQATTDSAWIEVWTNIDHTAGVETVIDTLGKTTSRSIESNTFNARGPAQGSYIMLIVRLANASATEWHVRGTFFEK